MCIELSCPGGNLRLGSPADGVVVDPDLPWMLDREELKSKCENSPFGEAYLQSRVLRTSWRGERKVYVRPCR